MVTALVALVAVPAAASAAVPPRDVGLISGGHSQLRFTGSGPAGISADGSRVLFGTVDQLVPQDHNGVGDTYARDRIGTLQLIGAGNEPTVSAASGHGSAFVGVSADGDRTWYTTVDHDLPSDVDASVDIYERRRDGALRQISGGTDFALARFLGASDSCSVLFATTESLDGADGDPGTDIYDRRADGSLHLVTPGTSQSVDFVPHSNLVSADGATATFFTSESLVPDDTDGVADAYAVSTATGTYTLLTPGTSHGLTARSRSRSTRPRPPGRARSGRTAADADCRTPPARASRTPSRTGT